jgi:IS30 family transposase
MIPKFDDERTLFQCSQEHTGSAITVANARLIECRIFLSENRFLNGLNRSITENNLDTGKPIPLSLAALLTTVERKSRYTKLAKLKRRTAKHVRIALNRTLSQYEKPLRRTITYDNGQENVEYVIVNKTLGTRSYFCQPFHSWEKGTVENRIGIVRRTYPKKTNFDLVSAADVKRLERKLNNTPRKVLHYRTLKEVFNQLRCTFS